MQYLTSLLLRSSRASLICFPLFLSCLLSSSLSLPLSPPLPLPPSLAASPANFRCRLLPSRPGNRALTRTATPTSLAPTKSLCRSASSADASKSTSRRNSCPSTPTARVPAARTSSSHPAASVRSCASTPHARGSSAWHPILTSSESPADPRQQQPSSLTHTHALSRGKSSSGKRITCTSLAPLRSACTSRSLERRLTNTRTTNATTKGSKRQQSPLLRLISFPL